MPVHHSDTIATAQLLAWALLAGMAVSLVLLAAWWNRPKRALALGIALTAFQAFHTLEHLLQLRQWFAAPWQQGWMSPIAHQTSVGLAAIADGLGLTGTGLGMELLHLVGNIVFLVGVLALWRAGLGGLSIVLIVFKAMHLLEHTTLTLTALAGLPAWGASTFFAQLSGAELSTYRVWWHLVMNAAAFALAVAVILKVKARPTWLVAGLTCAALTALPVIYATTTPGQPGYSQILDLLGQPGGWVALLLSPVVVTVAAALVGQTLKDRQVKGTPQGHAPDSSPDTTAKSPAAASGTGARAAAVSGLVVALALVTTAATFAVMPPRSPTQQEPGGWPVGLPKANLDGAIAALSRAALDGMLTLPVTARIGAWGAEGYKQALADTGGNRDVAVVAFTEVAAALAVNPGLAATIREPADSIQGDAREQGIAIAQSVVARAEGDGYLTAASGIPSTTTEPDWRWQGGIYGPESAEEPAWGTLETIFPVSTECRAQEPELTATTSEEQIAQQRQLAERYVSDPAVMALVLHWSAQETVARSEPWQSWVRVAQDNLPWGEADLRRDQELADLLQDIHHAVVLTWEGKWRWQVTSFPDRASSEDISNRLVPIPALAPAYPDEVSAVGAVVTQLLERAQVETVRVELPGKLTAAPRTRVLPSPQAVLSEAGDALRAIGMRSEADIKEGQRIGRCIAGEGQ